MGMSTAMKMVVELLGGGGANFTRLWDFTASDYEDQALADGVALTLVDGGKLVPGIDTANSDAMSIASGYLSILRNTAGTDTYWYGTDSEDNGFATSAGLTYLRRGIVRFNANHIGLSNAAPPTNLTFPKTGLYDHSAATRANTEPALYASSAGSEYDAAIIVRPEGIYILAKFGSVWQLLWADETNDWAVDTVVYPAELKFINVAGLLTYVAKARISQLVTSSPLYPVPQLSDGFSSAAASDGLGHIEGTQSPQVGRSVGDNISHLSGTWSVAGGVAYNAPVLGSDVIVTGDFSADTDWTKGTGWAIAAGVATKSAGTASALAQTVDPLTANTWYNITYKVANRTAGTIYSKCGTAVGITRSTNDTFTEVILANGAAFELYADASFDGDVDDVIVKPMTLAELISASQQTEYPFGWSDASFDAGFPSGACVQIDDPANPTSGQLMYWNTAQTEIVIRDIATNTILSSTAASFSDGTPFKYRLDSDANLWIWNNDAHVVTQAVTLSATNNYYGLFGVGSPSGETEREAIWDSVAVDYSEVL